MYDYPTIAFVGHTEGGLEAAIRRRLMVMFCIALPRPGNYFISLIFNYYLKSTKFLVAIYSLGMIDSNSTQIIILI
jgi:hypothetical protein